jgi:hypothetical protein|eukprot:29085-Pelagococcus_subviridis.AAC.7
MGDASRTSDAVDAIPPRARRADRSRRARGVANARGGSATRSRVSSCRTLPAAFFFGGAFFAAAATTRVERAGRAARAGAATTGVPTSVEVANMMDGRASSVDE